MIYMLIGIGVSIGVYFFDYRKIKRYSNIIYILATAIIILAIIPTGFTMNGISYWRIFNITIAPATLALPLYIIAFVGYIVDYKKNEVLEIKIQKREFNINKDLLKIIILSIISLFLMMSIPSFANTLILGISYLIITTIKILQSKEKRKIKLITMYGITSFIVGFIVIATIISSPYKLDRFITSFVPEVDPNGNGYVGMLKKDILHNAKLFGETEIEAIISDVSILNVESNYTFIYLLGKAGIVITSILVFLIILTSIRLIINCNNMKEEYGKLLVIGLSTLFILQSFATILMNLNLGIQTNVNLPFVTYGGVYFIVNILSIAIILSVYRRKDINEYDKIYKK